MTSLPVTPSDRQGKVALTTLGCARNDVDSDELRARLTTAGWEVTDDETDADVVLVNTCGFVASAKKDSIDTVLQAADHAPVIVTGCMAERYGVDLAAELPEAAAVVGFDTYERMPDIVSRVLRGEAITSHEPMDRRLLLPLTPVDRSIDGTPGTAGLARTVDAPMIAIKLASGCDRRCSFCAIPSFRGAFSSRRPSDVIHEVRQVVAQGAKEVMLVSENSTSYGKDLGDLRLLETLLTEIGSIPGLLRARANYLQPAEMRPSLERVIAQTPGVAPYFDLSFQHAEPSVLRRMRRFGGIDDFLALLQRIRALNPSAGVRSNVIVGFPGETESDLDVLADFIAEGNFDAMGVFGYSDEEGTEAVHLPGHLSDAEIADRVRHIAALVDECTLQRAEDRIGERVEVLIESCDEAGAVGRAAHQGPEDSVTVLPAVQASIGDVLVGVIIETDGPDLVAQGQ